MRRHRWNLVYSGKPFKLLTKRSKRQSKRSAVPLKPVGNDQTSTLNETDLHHNHDKNENCNSVATSKEIALDLKKIQDGCLHRKTPPKHKCDQNENCNPVAVATRAETTSKRKDIQGGHLDNTPEPSQFDLKFQCSTLSCQSTENLIKQFSGKHTTKAVECYQDKQPNSSPDRLVSVLRKYRIQRIMPDTKDNCKQMLYSGTKPLSKEFRDQYTDLDKDTEQKNLYHSQSLESHSSNISFAQFHSEQTTNELTKGGQYYQAEQPAQFAITCSTFHKQNNACDVLQDEEDMQKEVKEVVCSREKTDNLAFLSPLKEQSQSHSSLQSKENVEDGVKECMFPQTEESLQSIVSNSTEVSQQQDCGNEDLDSVIQKALDNEARLETLFSVIFPSSRDACTQEDSNSCSEELHHQQPENRVSAGHAKNSACKVDCNAQQQEMTDRMETAVYEQTRIENMFSLKRPSSSPNLDNCIDQADEEIDKLVEKLHEQAQAKNILSSICSISPIPSTKPYVVQEPNLFSLKSPISENLCQDGFAEAAEKVNKTEEQHLNLHEYGILPIHSIQGIHSIQDSIDEEQEQINVTAKELFDAAQILNLFSSKSSISTDLDQEYSSNQTQEAIEEVCKSDQFYSHSNSPANNSQSAVQNDYELQREITNLEKRFTSIIKAAEDLKQEMKQMAQIRNHVSAIYSTSLTENLCSVGNRKSVQDWLDNVRNSTTQMLTDISQFQPTVGHLDLANTDNVKTNVINHQGLKHSAFLPSNEIQKIEKMPSCRQRMSCTGLKAASNPEMVPQVHQDSGNGPSYHKKLRSFSQQYEHSEAICQVEEALAITEQLKIPTRSTHSSDCGMKDSHAECLFEKANSDASLTKRCSDAKCSRRFQAHSVPINSQNEYSDDKLEFVVMAERTGETQNLSEDPVESQELGVKNSKKQFRLRKRKYNEDHSRSIRTCHFRSVYAHRTAMHSYKKHKIRKREHDKPIESSQPKLPLHLKRLSSNAQIPPRRKSLRLSGSLTHTFHGKMEALHATAAQCLRELGSPSSLNPQSRSLRKSSRSSTCIDQTSSDKFLQTTEESFLESSDNSTTGESKKRYPLYGRANFSQMGLSKSNEEQGIAVSQLKTNTSSTKAASSTRKFQGRAKLVEEYSVDNRVDLFEDWPRQDYDSFGCQDSSKHFQDHWSTRNFDWDDTDTRGKRVQQDGKQSFLTQDKFNRMRTRILNTLDPDDTEEAEYFPNLRTRHQLKILQDDIRTVPQRILRSQSRPKSSELEPKTLGSQDVFNKKLKASLRTYSQRSHGLVFPRDYQGYVDG